MDDARDWEVWQTQRDEAAFARLVQRHAGLVSAACRRQLGACALADEAAQAVFLVLAQQRRITIRTDGLGGWLYGVAQRICQRARRTAARRSHHEQKAAMQSALFRAASSSVTDEEPPWQEIRPHLDAAIASLTSAQQAAVIAHFLEGLPQVAVAARLGISDDAVHQRIQAALVHLRRWFARRGVGVGCAALAAGLSSEASAAEANLITACTQAALQPSGAASAAALAGAESTLGAGTIVAWAAALVVAILGTGIVLSRANHGLSPGPTIPPLPVSAVDPPPPPQPPPASDLPPGALHRLGNPGLLAYGTPMFALDRVFLNSGTVVTVCHLPDGAVQRVIRYPQPDPAAPPHPQRGRGTLITGLSPTHDGRQVAIAGTDGVVRFFATDTGVQIQRWEIPVVHGNYNDDVRSLVWSRDGQFVIAATGHVSEPSTSILRCWSVAAGRELHAQMNTGDFALNPDGASVMMQTRAGRWQAVHLESGKTLWTDAIDERDTTRSIAGFLDDGAAFVVQAEREPVGEPKARILDVTTGQQTGVIALTGVRFPFRLATDGKDQVLIITTDHVHVRDRRGQPVRDIALFAAAQPRNPGNVPVPAAVRIASDGRYLACANRVYDLRSGALMRSFPTGPMQPSTSDPAPVQFVPDSPWVFAASKARLRLFALDSGQEVTALATGHDGGIGALAWSPDGTRLATAEERSATVRIWDSASGRLLHVCAADAGEGHSGRVVAWSPDGALLATTMQVGPFEHGIALWETATGRLLRAARGESSPTALLFSHDGRELISGHRQGTVGVWTVATAQRRMRFFGPHMNVENGLTVIHELADDGLPNDFTRNGTNWHHFAVQTLHLQADGRTLSVGYQKTHGPHALVRWDLQAGRQLDIPKVMRAAAQPLLFRSDGSYLQREPPAVLGLHDGADGRHLQLFKAESTYLCDGIACSPDLTLLATVNRGEGLTIWDAQRGVAIAWVPVPGLALAVAFAPDGKRLATGQADGTALIWDIATVLRQSAGPVPTRPADPGF